VEVVFSLTLILAFLVFLQISVCFL